MDFQSKISPAETSRGRADDHHDPNDSHDSHGSYGSYGSYEHSFLSNIKNIASETWGRARSGDPVATLEVAGAVAVGVALVPAALWLVEEGKALSLVNAIRSSGRLKGLADPVERAVELGSRANAYSILGKYNLARADLTEAIELKTGEGLLPVNELFQRSAVGARLGEKAVADADYLAGARNSGLAVVLNEEPSTSMARAASLVDSLNMVPPNADLGRRILAVDNFQNMSLYEAKETVKWMRPNALDISDHPQAIQAAQEAVFKNSAALDALAQPLERAKALNLRGSAYVRLGHYNLAKTDLTQAIELKQGSAVFPAYDYNKRGFSNLISGDELAADADYREGSRLRALYRRPRKRSSDGPFSSSGGFMF